jgi:murein DD-endopeptidase MepM/ murein hydrolase activator NlpD
LRIVFFVLAIFLAVSYGAAATKPVAKTASKAAVTKRTQTKPLAVRTRTTTTARTVSAKKPVARPAVRYGRTAARYASYSRFAPRNGRNRYRYAPTYFRPVLSATSADFPEMAAPLPNLSATELQDSFFYRRPDGIIHYAIDIFRPIGEPLLAAVDGYIERIDPNPLGGNVVYIVDEQKRFRFYYAHLERHAEGLYAGMPVKRGDVIGFVGDTGNAKGTHPHLHFQISNLAGAVVNPYPLLLDLVRRDEPVSVSE